MLENVLLIKNLTSKLIDVAQISYMSQGSKMHDQYVILFNQIFPKSPAPESSPTHPHESEQAWLDKALVDEDGKATTKWSTVEPIESGGLVMQFDEVLGMDKKSSKAIK